jgi:hypothetical protein
MFDNLPAAITSLATLIGAIGALILTIRNGNRARKTQEMTIEAHHAAESAKVAATIAADKAEELATTAKAQLVIINGQVLETRKALDGRLSQLLEEVRKSSRAEGVEEGRAAQKSDINDAKKAEP